MNGRRDRLTEAPRWEVIQGEGTLEPTGDGVHVQARPGQWTLRYIARNGEIILTSETHPDVADAEHAAQVVEEAILAAVGMPSGDVRATIPIVRVDFDGKRTLSPLNGPAR